MIYVRYECARVGCDEVVELDIDEVGERTGDVYAVGLPEGWGTDWIGLDRVLHCPEHYGTHATADVGDRGDDEPRRPAPDQSRDHVR